MQLSETQTKMAAVLIVLVVIGLAYVLWSRSVPPEPVPGPGQTLSNPFGPGGPSKPGGGSGGGPPAQVQLPAKGTFDRNLGFGPSKGAPIPGAR